MIPVAVGVVCSQSRAGVAAAGRSFGMADASRGIALTARLAAAHDALSRLGFYVAAGCLGVIVCSYCFEVVSRYFFNAPTVWAGPLVAYMLCALVFLAAPDLTRQNAHI